MLPLGPLLKIAMVEFWPVFGSIPAALGVAILDFV
jgi:hypothetical protein